MGFFANVTKSFKSLNIKDILLIVILIILVISIISYLFALNNIENVESFSSDQTISVSGADVTGNVGGDPIDMDSLEPLNKMKEDDVYIVLVYDSHCPHCVNFKETWHSVCNKYNGAKVNSKKVTFYQVGDKQDEVRQRFLTDYNVQGFPTVLVMKKNGEQITAHEYDGPREHAQMCNYISTKII